MITLKKAVSLLINEVRMKLQTFIVCSATQTQKHTHMMRAYWVIWPQSLGRWSAVFRVKHVEQTYLVGMFLTLRERGREKKEKVRVSASELSFILSSQPRGEKSMYVTPPWQLPPSSYLCFGWGCKQTFRPAASRLMAPTGLRFLGGQCGVVGQGKEVGINGLFTSHVHCGTVRC